MVHDYYAELPKRRIGAGVLFVDAEGLPLLVEPTYKPTWEIPGGVVEAGEDPRSCAAREVREELGLDVTLGRLLVIDHKAEALPRGDAMMLVYEGGLVEYPNAIQLQQSELRSFRFVPVGELNRLASETLAYRVRQAMHARHEGTVVETVNGRTV